MQLRSPSIDKDYEAMSLTPASQEQQLAGEITRELHKRVSRSGRSAPRLVRHSDKPILSPDPTNAWEAAVATNPGVVLDEASGEVIMLYRAAGYEPEHRVYLGMARSHDGGFTFTRESEKPVFGPSVDGPDAGCVEDPRIIRMGDWYYITYASRPTPPGHYWIKPPENRPWFGPQYPDHAPASLRDNLTTTHLAMTQDFTSFLRLGALSDPAIDDRDVIIFPEKIAGRYWMLQRPMSYTGESYGTDKPTIWISSGDDLLSMEAPELLMTRRYDWEGKIGGNTPPIKTEQGWLHLYHGVSPEDGYYRLGAILMDLDNPARVTHRTPQWLLQPELDWELEGYYPGVVFPCGSLILNDLLMVYYGGGDRHVGLATCPIDDLISYLLENPQ
ncbi:glycoside hydrolase family 130 protein [Mucisphaera sp.]|uniref:glycoside hydrolase family 130 protein n=1 Tax=Mucisphaera sp. TaxID=2913024 RepID=UPI003D147688